MYVEVSSYNEDTVEAFHKINWYNDRRRAEFESLLTTPDGFTLSAEIKQWTLAK